MSTEIYFYSTRDEWGEFSNFASYRVLLKKKFWPTSEHYFQAMKFNAAETQERIRKAKSPMIAARIGRSRKLRLRRDWESAKIGVMRTVVHAKFTQHDELRELLLSTEDAKLVERTSNDTFWGDGGDGRGKNWLGRILMEVRGELQKTNSPGGRS